MHLNDARLPAPTVDVQANLYALGAIALWISVATLGVALKHIPPFLLTGLALLIGSVLSLPYVLKDRRQWQVPLSTLALGIYGLFGYHFMLFMALRLAPAVEANLINYLWPLLIVVLAPVFLPKVTLRAVHIVAALMGFAGAAIAILGARDASAGGAVDWSWGYLVALGAAFMWASYSVLTKRVQAFPTAAIGLFGLVSGVLALLCHWLLEPATTLTGQDWLLLLLMGLGPLGGAFFLWDKALKLGDARQIGILSYLTPLGSTALLMVVSGRDWTWSIGLAAALVIGAALLCARSR